MKNDIDICQDLYLHLTASELKDAISGEISYTGRDDGSEAEDCIISVLDNDFGQVQGAFVNVNVYVQSYMSDGKMTENVPRLKALAMLCKKVLGTSMDARNFGTFRFYIEKQRILAVNGKDEYVINNKVKYQQSNDYNYGRN